MPRSFVVLIFFVILSVASAGHGEQLGVRGEQEYPYKAYVNADGVELRSGPGEDFYPTNKLQKGDMVEVYRRDGKGWCAIKPPEGSFSWISGRVLKLQGDNLAEVREDGAASRVGSSLSNVRDVIQVRMRKGESVEILNTKDGAAGDSQVWYKIAPPSGEFRWVAEKDLDKQKPLDTLAGARADDFNSYRDRPDGRPDSQPASRASDGSNKISSAQLQNELDRIDMELSMMVVEDLSAWSFDAMRIRGETLLEQADTAADRGKARLLLNKIARFDDIKRRYDDLTAARERNATSSRFLAGLKNTLEKTAAAADPDGQYDGIGQLQQVFSPKIGTPRYALVDEAGNVRYYVTPAPGMNLQGYVGRQVGINGARGYMPEQRSQHITARHITSLDTLMR